jgi:hypothetical protein
MYQPYASTNMSTMCVYQYANHVHLPIFQPSVISLMICLHHEPSIIIMYLNQSSVSTISVYQYIISMSVPNMYINMYLYQSSTVKHASIPQQNESSYMYAKSTTKHVPIKLLVGASTNALEVYQSCINYRSSLNPPFTTSDDKHPTISSVLQ